MSPSGPAAHTGPARRLSLSTMKRRERHGRGVRGPLAAPNRYTGTAVQVPYRTRGVEFFAGCLKASAARIHATCPHALDGVDVGFEDIPILTEAWLERVPLASATPAEPGRNARVVVYRRPLEHRANSRTELARLVHRAVAEQLAALTGIALDELDPRLDED